MSVYKDVPAVWTVWRLAGSNVVQCWKRLSFMNKVEHSIQQLQIIGWHLMIQFSARYLV